LAVRAGFPAEAADRVRESVASQIVLPLEEVGEHVRLLDRVVQRADACAAVRSWRGIWDFVALVTVVRALTAYMVFMSKPDECPNGDP